RPLPSPRRLPLEPEVALDALGGIDLRRDSGSTREERRDREGHDSSPHRRSSFCTLRIQNQRRRFRARETDAWSTPLDDRAERRDLVDEIIVVDNGSTDRTAEIAAAAGARVVREPTRGYGAACLAGALAAGDTDILVFLDGDRNEDPAELPRVLGPVLAGEAD